jgi:hypothetical protein
MKVLKWVLIVLVVMSLLGHAIKFIDPEGYAKSQEVKPASAATIAGGMVAVDMAQKGRIKPNSDAVDAIARQAATKFKVPQEERAAYVREFTQGFWIGWKSSTQ